MLRRPEKRRDDPDDVFCATPAPSPSIKGDRIAWIRSSDKEVHDAMKRRRAVEDALFGYAVAAVIADDVIRDDAYFDAAGRS